MGRGSGQIKLNGPGRYILEINSWLRIIHYTAQSTIQFEPNAVWIKSNERNKNKQANKQKHG